jgi:uroporphyrin-III C-methyltransferase/precorrin-2 dehydrogenase/sirohydrochlorin ferrochelatase
MSAHRKPSEMRSPRMGALARLPVFFALEGKRAVVAGDGPGAAWKAELLSAAGAAVDVFAAEPCEELHDLANDPPNGPVHLCRRDSTAGDLSGAAISVGAFDDDERASAFAAMARAAGVPVNLVDRPALCDFSFGTIVNRSPLVVGISTDGAAPIFAQAVRAKIEALLPAGFAAWADAARRWRALVQSSGLSFAGRRRFWQLFAARAVTEPNRAPDETERNSLIASVRSEGQSVERGSVMLVGAGPGDPELLTLRAVRALQSADVILIDDLVAPEILDFARREAKKMLIGKTGHAPSCKQEDINTLMVALARSGKRVVRLKGGDPMIFGRAGEEIAACRAAGITVEVVPGITAAQGAAGRLGISLTHRDHARRIQFVTGHDRHGRLAPDLDWQSLADGSATTAIYMPSRTLKAFIERVAAHGLPLSTPAAAIVNATRKNEMVMADTLAGLPQRLAASAPAGPMLVLVGEAVRELLLAGRGHNADAKCDSIAAAPVVLTSAV